MSRRYLWGIAGLGVVFLFLMFAGEEADLSSGLPGDSLAIMLYAGLLLAVLAAGVIRSGMRFGSIARNLALWAMVILGLVAGYQYRYELQDVASRVTAGLIPGSPMSVTDAEGRATVMIDKAGNGHFETTGTLNGTAIRFMIDTGASTVVLTPGDAERAGYDVSSLAFNVPISTANGMARAARATADEMSVGTIERQKLPVLVAQPGMLQQSLLGMNFIGSLSSFEVRGDRMILRD